MELSNYITGIRGGCGEPFEGLVGEPRVHFLGATASDTALSNELNQETRCC